MRDNKFNGVDSHSAENRRKTHRRKSPPPRGCLVILEFVLFNVSGSILSDVNFDGKVYTEFCSCFKWDTTSRRWDWSPPSQISQIPSFQN